MKSDSERTGAPAVAVQRFVSRLLRKIKCFFGWHDWQGEDSTPGYPTRICVNCKLRMGIDLVDMGRQKMWVKLAPRKPDPRCVHGRLLDAGCADCDSMMRGLINNPTRSPRR